jgi:hypothetical protein
LDAAPSCLIRRSGLRQSQTFASLLNVAPASYPGAPIHCSELPLAICADRNDAYSMLIANLANLIDERCHQCIKPSALAALLH